MNLQIQHMLTVFDVLGEWFSVCTCVSLATSFTEAPHRIILMCSHQLLFTELMAYIDNMLNTVSLLSVVHRMFNLLFIFLTCLMFCGITFQRYKKYLKNTKWTEFTSNIWWKLTEWAIWNWWKLTKRLLALLLRTEFVHITSW